MKIPIIGAAVPPRGQRDWVTTQELLAEAGLTYRQADYWIRTGLLTAFGGRLNVDQVARARVIRQLLDAGLSLQTIRQDIDELLAAGQVTHDGVTFVLNQTGDAA